MNGMSQQLPTGQPIGLPIATHMGIPVGMPMMGLMARPPMPIMPPMFPAGVDQLLVAAAPTTSPLAVALPVGHLARVEAEERKAKLLKDLEEANAELSLQKECALVWDRAKRKWALASVASRPKAQTEEPSSGQTSREGTCIGKGDADHSEAAARGGASASSSEAVRDTGEEEAQRCHLHSRKKPNAKCKFCQRAQGQSVAKAEQEAKASVAAVTSAPSRLAQGPGRTKEPEAATRRLFNCSPMLKDQIISSSYFRSLMSIDSIEDLTEEITKYADTLDVYNAGSNVSPSCFACHVYRLFTLTHAEDLDEIQAILDHPESGVVRCAGFLCIRFVMPPSHLWELMEEYLFDDMELRHAMGGKQVTTTIGKYVESLLASDKYFETPLPRIPHKVRQVLEKELAPLQQYRKRMDANLRTFRSRPIAYLPVEVCVEGSWLPGTAKEFAGRCSLRRKVLVQLEGGAEACVHLGKVVLRDDPERSGSESGSECTGRRRRRSRSRRRSPDWSRWKGKGETEMVEEFREKAKEEAVCGHGKSYARRPMTMEEELWKRDPETRVSMLGDDSRQSFRRPALGLEARENEAPQRQRREEDLEHQRRLREIYEKYGSCGRPAIHTATARPSDVEAPDVLRLG
mmetsp:Transcript_19013/g.60381  ORF Transcript_19013/g.60381 Transcript_19013/m.60381 type:complete len:630 (-) Transcript_19013:98-1987(-)